MPKRSCDFCVRRKIRCDAGRPCRRCVDAKPPLDCTYLNPVLKRGPKTSKLTQRRGGVGENEGRWRESGEQFPTAEPLGSSLPGGPQPQYLRASTFAPVIEAYRSRMYPVWPVCQAPKLQARLRETCTEDGLDVDAYTLAAALSAATMAQLNLPPLIQDYQVIDSAYMEKECRRVRTQGNYREHPSPESVLASFFLHVYHAKADHRNAAMMHLQEAIALARLLHLDDIEADTHASKYGQDHGLHSNKLLYPLLWVSERGYAIQFGLRVSIQETLQIPLNSIGSFDTYGKGLIELASLFAAFDSTILNSPLCKSRAPENSYDKQLLVDVHNALTSNVPRPAHYDIVQRADYLITKQWMEILLWQRAMSAGLLSSSSNIESMTFLFPSHIAQQLLASITSLSKDDLLPLGRDQLIKFFEITNTLADVILCSPVQNPLQGNPSRRHHNDRDYCQYGPADYLHGLFQTISPFLESDKRLRDMLREKAAEALLKSPSRVLPGSIGDLPHQRARTSTPNRNKSYMDNAHQADDLQLDPDMLTYSV